MIIKRKFFGDIATGVGLAVGLGGGAYLGNKLHAKYDYIKAKRKFDPEKSAEKKEKEAKKYESTAKSLRSNKDYMKRFKEAKKARNEVYNRFDKGKAEEWELDSADENFYRKVPEGDVEFIESSASTAKSKAKDIRENPKKYREKAGKEAKVYRNLNPGGTGAKIGAAIGALGGGILGARL